MSIVHEILEAEERIRTYIKETPLEHSLILSKMGSCEVYLKLENQQVTNSFKIRGAMNSLLYLNSTYAKSSFVTASSGNHGAAFAYGVEKLKLKGTIFLPENASPVKIRTLKRSKVDVRLHGEDCVEAEIYARNYANENSLSFISPYNDIKIVAGQGTIAIEIEKQLGCPEYVLVPVGGGGLISGIGGYLKNKFRQVKIIGCQPVNSPVMYESVKAGKIIDYKSRPTLSDGTAGGIEPNSITYDFCVNYVDDYILVSENEIKRAMNFLYEEHNMVVEGAAALTVASFLKNIAVFRNSKVVLIISGSRIDEKEFMTIIVQ